MFSRNSKAEKAALGGQSGGNRKIPPAIISQDLHILGNLISEGTLDVDGSIEGNIKARHVTLRANAKLAGDVVAEQVHVYGQVRGLVRAHSVYLYTSCHVEGVIMYKSLTVEDGAVVDGKFKRIQDKLLSTPGRIANEDADLSLADDEAANLRLIR